MTKKPIPPNTKNHGFALVVTLSLMVLLTIIAVGLLTLSSITLRSTSNSSAMSMARQNARLAMMLAIGELQKHAGQDQRITAIADIAGYANGTLLAAGAQPLNEKSINSVNKGLSAVKQGTRYWTGVWRNSNTSATANTEIFTKTPSPQFVQWLISGNETSSAVKMTPASNQCSIGNDGTVSDPKTAVVLVGRETVGDPSTASLGRYVAAPLVPITAAKGAASQTVGRYGWWVGDEGVKAKINIPKTNNDNNSYASLSAQRRGWETVTGFTDYPTPSSGGHASLAKIITLPEAALLVASANTGSGGATALQSVFHAATADSRAVIADTMNGGTKVDLSAMLSGALPASNPVPSLINFPTKNGNIVPSKGAITLQNPRWDVLKEFYDRYKTLQGGSLIVKAAASANEVAIAPLITDFRILMGVKFVPTTSNAGAAHKANACGKIAIAIANPYSVPLKWNSALEFEIRNLTPPGNGPARIWNLGSNSVFISSTEPAVFNQTVFRIQPASLAPGEARAYTLTGSTLRPVGTGTQKTIVDMGPFGSSLPFDFTKCVELDANGAWPYRNSQGDLVPLPDLDVRESWQTTYIGVDMRLSGSSSSAPQLRRIEGFELDNGYYVSNTRKYDPAGCQARPKPVPLMCFSFQTSRSGVDYLADNLMPPGYDRGQRSSTMRTFTDFNLQATRIRRPITSYNAPPYFMESNNGFALLLDAAPGGDTGRAFTKNLDTTMAWGHSFNGPSKTVLFSVPSQFTSLAQFQHADLTGDDSDASIGHQPGNAFANSYATPFVKRSLTVQPRKDFVLKGATDLTGTNITDRKYYDISHLLNTAIWDSYFLSTIKSSASGTTAENPSLIRVDTTASANLTDPVKCASSLMIDGAFNVNCTDKNAWKAFLASSKHFKHKADTGASTDAAFPRSLEQISPSSSNPTGTAADSFSGSRRLTDSELDKLATEIVKQVRIRGPFVSLSHFVNRAIGDLGSQPAMTRCGALQAAIDESGATINFAGNKKGLTGVGVSIDRLNLSEKNGAPRADMDGEKTVDRPPDVDSNGNPLWAASSQDRNYGSVASIVADRTMLSTSKNEQGYRSTGIPGWLTQADVLQVIGPSITNRSDTFRIRAYGESLDSSGNTLAKAYCEAIVQRIPNYVDPADSASERGAELTDLNKIHGRQFTIVSFRWLSPQEI